ncbi:uncharacterized protein EV422DRAFT_510118 [Fimicolochytrium jonesii]|uniref:uncharacterized protein n=1 Tax=Fimicolochytrium jonesii TaxID=1396493 RepID=UPI0022FE4798|nr:uncharacterized protein EV422DRAFT_510118 [Fimicolochytrium jonesii]KAI8815987.1 hypothetical protein EV422DRAFT_510118 [Fimicolochytrium jonesii]
MNSTGHLFGSTELSFDVTSFSVGYSSLLFHGANNTLHECTLPLAEECRIVGMNMKSGYNLDARMIYGVHVDGSILTCKRPCAADNGWRAIIEEPASDEVLVVGGAALWRVGTDRLLYDGEGLRRSMDQHWSGNWPIVEAFDADRRGVWIVSGGGTLYTCAGRCTDKRWVEVAIPVEVNIQQITVSGSFVYVRDHWNVLERFQIFPDNGEDYTHYVSFANTGRYMCEMASEAVLEGLPVHYLGYGCHN